jgi:uncharacterized protein YcnI
MPGLTPLRRALVVAGALPTLLVAAAGAASAHVTVHADDATSGASDVAVTFRTPNEMDDASTTKLEVYFPSDTPLLGVLVQQHPGWTGKAVTTKLTKPVTTDDGTITEAVSEVVWTPDTAADALHPGQSADFVVTAGQLPPAKSLTFKALQTYSDGTVVRWIEVPQAGGPELEHAAPVLDLAAVKTAAAATSEASVQGNFVSAGSSTHSTSDDAARVLGVVGIVIGLAGVGFGVFTGRSSRRRVEA